MKKNLTYKKIFLTTLVITSLFSCDSFLDRQEDESLTFDKVWQTRVNTERYWQTSISYYPNDAYDFQYNPYMGASDEGTCHFRDRGWQSMISGAWNPSNMPYVDYYRRYYQGIREANIFLANVDRCKDPLLKDQEREMWKVQTRFARAYYHFMLMKLYGPIILMHDDILDFSLPARDLARPRSSWDECIKYVCNELEDLAKSPYMETTWQQKETKGLGTKGACYAIIARLKLYSARNLYNGNVMYASVKNHDGKQLFPQNYDNNKWREAAEAAKMVIESGWYSLYRSANNNPYDNYYGITNENWNSELIWTTRYESRFIIQAHCTPTGMQGNSNWGGQGPTQQQVDAYAMKNGKYPINSYYSDGSPIIDENSGYPTDELTLSEMDYPAVHGAQGYKLTTPKMFANREPRFYVTVYISGSRWIYGNQYQICSFARGANSNTSDAYPHSGYMLSKLVDHKLNVSSQGWGSITFPTFRLGEMYLNFIEAALECSKHGVTDEYLTQAMDLWKELRDRSGMKPITDSYPGSSIEKLIELYRNERRVELAFENHRFFDTRTWMIAEKTDGGKMWGMNVNTPGSGEAVPDQFWKRTVFGVRIFQKQHYLFPFSSSEMELNHLLVQNYGW